LQLTVHEFPADQIRSLTWQRGKDSGKFEATADGEWSADLSGLAWKRGDYPVRVSLQTTGEMQEFPRELVLRYQPPRPEVRFVGVPPRVVDKAEYKLKTEVVPGTGQSVEIRLSHRNDGKELPVDKPWSVKEKTTVEKTFTLKPGLNQIKVLARNAEGDEEWQSVDVLFKTARPQISITAIVPLPGEGRLRPDPDKADKPLAVDSARVRIEGTIEALDPLTAASWVTDAKDDKRKPFDLSKKPTKLTIEQEVTLAEPGKPLTVRFFAKTAASELAEQAIVLRYEPRLPELRVTSPVEGQPLYEGKDNLSVKVEARLVWPEGAYPCTAQLIVNDKEQDEPVKLAAKAASFTGTAKLQPGENWLQVRLKNEWWESTTPRLLVTYRRPPKVASLTAPAKSTKAFVDAVAMIESPKGLPLTTLRFQGHDQPADRFQPVLSQEKGEVSIWKVTLKEVPLKKGKNVLTLQASNRDGWSLQTTETTVVSEEAVQPKATVELLSPAQSAVVDAPEMPVVYRILSTSPLKKVEIHRNGEAVYRKEKVDLEAITKTGDQYELRESRKVALQSGVNSLKIVAQNDGGEQESAIVALTYQTGPATVLITHLDADTAPLGFADDKLLFPKVPQAKTVIHGIVQWEPSGDAQMAKVSQVRVYVNGCQQPPAVLEKASPSKRERAFKTEVRLTRAEGNLVAVKLPDLAENRGSRNHCLLDCAKPDLAAEPRRQAHLLVVDTGKDGDKVVVQRVLDSLKATPAGENRFAKEGFADGGRIYGPLVGTDVAPDRVYVQLLSIKRNLKLRAAAGATNDVVFIYFRGGEALDAQGHFLRTADSERDPELRWSGLPCDYLTRYCAENLGAQLVMLDVTREVRTSGGATAQDKVLQWPDDPSVAVFRYAWSGKPQDQTPDARLLSDWTHAMGHGKKLSEVASFIEKKFNKTDRKPWLSKDYGARLAYSEQVPPGLEDAHLGGKDK
jgi:hypothetical protein